MLHRKPFCFYCQRTLNSHHVMKRGDRCKGLDMTTDHKTPLARGGADRAPNRVPCCFRCNNLKADMTAQEFHVYVSRFGYEQQPRYIKDLFKYDRRHAR